MMRKQQIWNETKDYLFITIGLLLYTISFTVFLMPYQIVAGGVTGLAAIVYYATGFRIENTYIIINLALHVVALKVLCVLAKKNESTEIFRLIKMIDPNAFVSQSSVIGVYGEGFDEMKVKIKKKKEIENA